MEYASGTPSLLPFLIPRPLFLALVLPNAIRDVHSSGVYSYAASFSYKQTSGEPTCLEGVLGRLKWPHTDYSDHSHCPPKRHFLLAYPIHVRCSLLVLKAS
eukprot:scaffold86_cov338-Pavlova_lutheri.AAC.54